MARDSPPPSNPAPQSIPLRDLSRPPDPSSEELNTTSDSQAPPAGHARNGSLFARITREVQYARLEADESPTRGVGGGTLEVITGHGSSEAGDEGYSPIDLQGFASAHGGLSFDSHPGPSTPDRGLTRPVIITTPADGDGDAGSIFSPQDEDDMTPLTKKRSLKPKLRSPGTNDRLSRNSSLRWLEGRDSSPRPRGRSSRLGDDLPNLNTNIGVQRKHSTSSGIERLSTDAASGVDRSRSNSRSLSPSPSPLARANSIFREISQRVVNISNDSEMVEQSIRRKSTMHHPRRSSVSRQSHDPEASPGPHIPTIIEPEAPLEKTPSIEIAPEPILPRRYPNPLRGKSLGIFGPENRLRKRLLEILTHPWAEPIILVLIIAQTVLLAVNAASDAVYLQARSREWGRSTFDYAIFALFIIYTVEVVARIIVSGFWSNPIEYSVIDRSMGVKKGIITKFENLFSLQRKESVIVRRSSVDFQPSIVRAFTGMPDAHAPGHGRQKQRLRLARRAFLRHSFNRLDFVAVVSYWISFVMQISGYETRSHLYLFNMLSCLRTLRLLGLTAGTSIILRSLKKAAPLLVNVAFLICFFWLIFAIIGVQSFKSSLRRTCVWVGDDGSGQNYTWNVAPENVQFCGGHLDAITGLPMPWLKPDGSNGTQNHKGYLCPQMSLCVEGEQSIYNGTVSFDNIFQSLELVFVVISSNTFSDLMYYLTNSDYLIAALFFAVGIVILAMWLVNLLVAVITSSFQIIREESKHSAFTVQEVDTTSEEGAQPKRPNKLKQLFDKTKYFWVIIIAVDLIIASLRSATMGRYRAELIMNTETVVTFMLLFEIILRFICDWRGFFKSKRNWVDLIIAIVTTIMQIPQIRNSGQPYAWLSAFQIARIYRVVLAVALTRELVMIVFGNAIGLINLIVFVFLFTFLAAILASQLLRADLPPIDNGGQDIEVQFFDIWNSFIGMYIILSSENWTSIMYNITEYNLHWKTAWIGALFCITWFIVANMIVLNMFIAVIQESFDVSEDEKRLQQVKAFLRQKELSGSTATNVTLSSILRLGRDSAKHRDALEYGEATMQQLLKDAVVKDFLDEHDEPHQRRPLSTHLSQLPTAPVDPNMIARVWNRVTGASSKEDPNPFYSNVSFARANEEFDARQVAKQVFSATENRKRAQRQYLARHPHYNVSLFMFKADNPVRKLCQYLVGPSRGDDRPEGVAPWPPAWYTFSALTYMAIVAMVIIACITTPLYQREYFSNNSIGSSWIVWTDMGFAILFTVEALIKIVADGFFFAPNAYFRNIWGVIDVIVLLTLWVSVFSQIYRDDAISRGIGAFKALRALRLLNISDSARNTFHSVIVVGGYKIISAAFVSLSLLIPFAILGVNLFNGQMEQCNDQNFAYSQLTDCVGEWNSTPSGWNVLAPRTVSNPYYDFDDFGSALFILFQIVSQEGWTGVLQSAMSITGRGLQPQSFSSQGNAVYFIIFNLLGAVFVLTLFISVFMRNYTEQTGVAFLTAEQRSWLELRKLLKQISPSKRSIHDSSKSWRKWCYDLSSKKRGKWQRFITVILLFHLLLLLIEFYPEPSWWEVARDSVFLILTLIYITNIIIRITGLTWHRFRRSSWDLFSLPSVIGSFLTSLMALIQVSNNIIDQLHKLFLVSVLFLLIPRNNQLDQLFKTAAASLPLIANLLATWFVLFLVYAIALTQAFGLTRFGENENGNINFRTVPKALILLFRTSIGEGWNQLMEDFATIEPPFCVMGDTFLDSDCGSSAWARGLFVSWNIISMYIFVSLFVSLIFESFSYVYQRSGGMSIISRDEIRRFKQAWSEFDPNGTGWISKERFPRLLGELSGVFQMRVYEGDFTVHNILADTVVQPGDPLSKNRRVVDGVDLDKLAERVSHIPVNEIRRRREQMDVFYHEMLLSADPDRGISFTSCLMILAHYNVITDSKSLRLEEFLRRRARLQRVHESIRRDTVIGFLNMLYWSRRFRKATQYRRDSRVNAPPQLDIPEIFVEDPEESLASSSDILPHDFTASSPLQSPRSTLPSALRIDTSTSNDYGVSPRGSLSPRGSPMASPVSSPRRLSAVDTSYAGPSRSPPETPSLGSRHIRNESTMSSGSARGVMESFDASAWGESIRRSFTTKRHSEN